MITEGYVRTIFKGLENGDGASFFEHVADDVDWTVMGTHPLAGAYKRCHGPPPPQQKTANAQQCRCHKALMRHAPASSFPSTSRWRPPAAVPQSLLAGVS